MDEPGTAAMAAPVGTIVAVAAGASFAGGTAPAGEADPDAETIPHSFEPAEGLAETLPHSPVMTAAAQPASLPGAMGSTPTPDAHGPIDVAERSQSPQPLPPTENRELSLIHI